VRRTKAIFTWNEPGGKEWDGRTTKLLELRTGTGGTREMLAGDEKGKKGGFDRKDAVRKTGWLFGNAKQPEWRRKGNGEGMTTADKGVSRVVKEMGKTGGGGDAVGTSCAYPRGR